MCCCSCWFLILLERSLGWRTEIRNFALWEKLAEQVFRLLDIFRCWFYEPDSCISSCLEKHQNPSWWQVFLVTSRSLQNICAWLHALPLHQNHVFTDFPPTTLEQFLRAIWNVVSLDIVFILLPNKTYLATLKHCVCFFFFQVTSLRWGHDLQRATHLFAWDCWVLYWKFISAMNGWSPCHGLRGPKPLHHHPGSA